MTKDTEMLCRLCKKADESRDHVVSDCSKLAQKDYKRRPDNLRKIVHYFFEAGDWWFEHKPEIVLENEDYKIINSFGNYLARFAGIVELWKLWNYHGIL